MNANLAQYLATIRHSAPAQEGPAEDTISVSETVSVAASVYETVRNTLEYDEEHLLERNAIRRILKRRLGEGNHQVLARELLRELIWAQYLKNKSVPESTIDTVAMIVEKYDPLFASLESETKKGSQQFEWLVDILSTEIHYALHSTKREEALASFAYQELRGRMQWNSSLIKEEDRDLQLYAAVHRALLKSNRATLRFRMLTLFYPEWTTATVDDPIVEELAQSLDTVIESVEKQINHPGADAIYRTVRKHAVVFQLLSDIAKDDPATFELAVQNNDSAALEGAITKAASARYSRFKANLSRGVMRAVLFLFITKFFLALVVEWPFERFILGVTHWTPLVVNTIFPPVLLGLIGLTVRIPEKRNNEQILKEAMGLLGLGQDFHVPFKQKHGMRGPLGTIFRFLYLLLFIFVIGFITTTLLAINFNSISIVFFLLFLSLVTFYGLKIRNTKKELVIVETGGGLIGALIDIMFLPLIRAGRVMALNAPRLNIFLFFFDFIIEAPFKGAIRVIEGWLAYLREKKEEI